MDALRDGIDRLASLFGVSQKRVSPRWHARVAEIAALEDELQQLGDDALRKRSLELRYRARCGESFDDLTVPMFALVREAGRRRLNMRHFDVQLLAGMAMVERAIVEMQTGEGKTLTATLPTCLLAIAGRGAHVATVNDYLARRDAEWMRPIYAALGLTVGIVESDTSPTARRAAYACDVTYGTGKEFGFDFLRDRLLERHLRDVGLESARRSIQATADDRPVQREPYFALVDEADSVLIDDAGTPLVIASLPGGDEKLAAERFAWATASSGDFLPEEDYEYDHVRHSVQLTVAGRRKVRSLAKPRGSESMPLTVAYEFIERAIKVRKEFSRDRHYVVRDGEVVIVDEFTGRVAEGRKWRDGIHQAVEAHEGLKITLDTGQAARVTVQEFFRRYEHLAGMTGTASTSSSELKRIYGVSVVTIPTNRPAIRKALPEAVFGKSEECWAAVVEEVRAMHASGRPVLVGTRSIDKSEYLSHLLSEAGVEHQVLNARHIAREAEIVAQAGQLGRVTVATNMAGRGTDVRLGEGVADLGGMHVVATEMHDSARIDRQLIGRCGRQGDPGSYRQFMSLDDDILTEGLGPDEAERLKQIGQTSNGSFDSYVATFRRAQQKVERRKARSRRVLMYLEQQRNKAQAEMGLDPYLDLAT